MARERYEDDGGLPTVVKVGAGIGIGALIFYLLGVKGFGLGQASASAPPAPGVNSIVEIVIRPRQSGMPDPGTEIVMGGQPVSMEVVLERVRASGRREILVTVTGDTVQGDFDAVVARLAEAGIAVLRRQPQTPAAAPPAATP